VALLLYYRRLIGDETRGLLSGDPGRRARAGRLAGLILAATVPTGIVGILLKRTVEGAFENLAWVGAAELATALLLAVSFLRRGGRVTRETMTYGQAIAIGIFQGFAVLPGLSRSGSTIAAGLMLGLAGVWAADFAFLLAIPGIAGAAVVENLSVFRERGFAFFQSPDFVKYCFGGVVAGVVGYLTIAWMIRLVSDRRIHFFAIYCAIFGIILLFVFGRGPA